MPEVVCLRPEADFARVGVSVPRELSVRYLAPDDAELPAAMRSAEALVIPAVGPKLPLELFRGPALRLVQVTGAGVDRLDVEGLAALGIPVANVPGGSGEAIAEYALSCAAVLRRRIGESTAAILAGDYAAVRTRLIEGGLDELGGLTVGVVGFGVIGRAVAARFRAAGARILFFDPVTPDPTVVAAMAAERRDLDDLLAEADIVTLHVPLQPGTTNLIDARRLGLLRPGAVLIQASRGGVLDEAALAAALESGRIGGAAVDVYSTEPPTAENPLLRLSAGAAARVLLTPHVAGVTRQSWASLFRSAWENVVRVLVQGDAPHHVVAGFVSDGPVRPAEARRRAAGSGRSERRGGQ